ncbi:MAG: F0F1 ATP synthase subunit alpha [Clostridia bacterium]|nr:F0F1 ATP synthase subunit alpha [Clostridia bacterium]
MNSEEELKVHVRQKVSAAFQNITTIEEVGTVQSLSDGVAMVSGLEHCVASELVVFAGGSIGIAMNLEKDQVGVVLLTGENLVNEGTVCTRTGSTVSVPVGHGMLGRVVDPLGNPIDGKGIIRFTKKRPVESPAPSIVDRSPVNTPLHTGITAIDALTPIGRGQRELIIGDRQTGKTAIAIDTILNQKDKNVICVYVAIGQKMSTIVSTVNLLERYGALDYTVVVAASSSQSAALQYIAPFSGCAIAEEFMYEHNKDVLIVYDDLSKHAHAYRAISLLLRRPPGREAYPGDVFYLHSRLLERAAKLSEAHGGGSITALPIIETLGDDISAYIPTNVISITDGQIYLAPELFFSGQRPAVNVGLSVSRVGGAAQTKATKKVGGPLRIALAQAREMASFAQFGSDLDENTRIQLQRGIVLNEVLKQEQFSPLQMEEQVVLLYMATNDSMNFLAKEDIKEYYTGFLSYVRLTKREVYTEISESGVFSDTTKQNIDVLLDTYKTNYVATHPEYQEKL